MQDFPPLADRGRRERKRHGYEPQDIHDTGASTWIAALLIIAAVAVFMAFSQSSLKNGGAPFIIVPPSQNALPSAGNS